MLKLLFICTHNRCRSILAEAITRHESKGLIDVRSAGSQPVGEVHPLSLKYLAECGIDTKDLRSQSWDEFEDFSPDFVITVCDSAAGEQCPLWMGNSQKVHWGLKDPSKIEGTEEILRNAFHETIDILTHRINRVLETNIEKLPPNEQLVFLKSLAE
jgi:arsenate reductase